MVNYLLTEELVNEAKQEILAEMSKPNVFGWSGFNIDDVYKGSQDIIQLTASTKPIAGSAVVTYNNKIHFIGGWKYGSTGSQSVVSSFHQCYDPSDGTVVTVATENVPSASDVHAIVYGGKIHAFTGAAHKCYDSTNGWVDINDLNGVSLTDLSGIVLNNNTMYMITNSALYTWTESSGVQYLCDLPFDYYYGAIAMCGDILHIFCGNGKQGEDDGKQHYTYDITSGKFNEAIPMPYSADINMRTVTVGDVIHLIGGRYYGATTDIPDTYSDGLDHYKLSDGEWIKMPDIQKIVNSDQIAYLDGKIYGLTESPTIMVEYGDILNNVSGYLPKDTKIFVEGDTTPVTNVEKQSDGSLVVSNDGYVEFNSDKIHNNLRYGIF